MRAIAVLLFLALTGSATAAALSGEREAGPEASALAVSGSFGLANSREGMPVFGATEIAPGDSFGGTVEIADTGTLPSALTLTQHDLTDTPGPGGGRLSQQLTLRVLDVTTPTDPATVYRGPLASMPAQAAGQLEPGQSRTYEFLATLPDAGAGGGQNGLQGAGVSVAYSWTAREAPPRPVGPATPGAVAPASGSAGATPASHLRLILTRTRSEIQQGRLLLWARCNRPCRISARGYLSARGPGGKRAANLRGNRTGFAAAVQRLSIRIPGPLRRWLGATRGRERLRARAALLARDRSGETARRHVDFRPAR